MTLIYFIKVIKKIIHTKPIVKIFFFFLNWIFYINRKTNHKKKEKQKEHRNDKYLWNDPLQAQKIQTNEKKNECHISYLTQAYLYAENGGLNLHSMT